MSSDVFATLGNPLRRRILAEVARRPLAVQDLAVAVGRKRPAVSEQLRILRAAGLVDGEQRGKERVYSLVPQRLDEVRDWLAELELYWQTTMSRIDGALDEEDRE